MPLPNAMSDGGFTRDELLDAFLSVANSTDWRKPICRTVTVESDRDTLRILRAIDLLAGGGATLTVYMRRDGRRTLTVRAPGHYAMVNRSALAAPQKVALLYGGFVPHQARAVDIDIAARSITLQCVRCDTTFSQALPHADAYELRRLSVLWSFGGTGCVAYCPTCDPPEHAKANHSSPAQ